MPAAVACCGRWKGGMYVIAVCEMYVIVDGVPGSRRRDLGGGVRGPVFPALDCWGTGGWGGVVLESRYSRWRCGSTVGAGVRLEAGARLEPGTSA